MARDKQAYQSGLSGVGTADEAVDGSSGTCSRADTNTTGYTPNGGSAWWQLDLETEHDVIELTIHPLLINNQIGKSMPQGQFTSARFCLYTFLLKKIGGFRPIQKLTCPTTLYKPTSTKDMNGSELHTTSYLCQPLPDFNSLAGDACEHFSQVLTHVKHISLNIDLVNKLHIHLPLGI